MRKKKRSMYKISLPQNYKNLLEITRNRRETFINKEEKGRKATTYQEKLTTAQNHKRKAY